jgi:hypothetical protein
MGKLGAGLLVNDIRERFNNSRTTHKVSNSKSDHRFVLYSAHDGTLLALMSALNLKHLAVPHYASHLAFELYFDKSTSQYVLSLVYDDERLLLQDCKSKSNVCNFEEWSTLVIDSIPLNWQEECGLVSPIPSQSLSTPSSPIMSLVIGFVFGCISIYALVVTGKITTKLSSKSI